MSKIKVRIELTGAVSATVTLTELAELYEELGEFFAGDDEEEYEQCRDEAEDKRIEELLGRGVIRPNGYPWDYPWDVKPFSTNPYRHGSGCVRPSPGWINVTENGVCFNLDDAGIPFYSKDYDG